MIFLKTFHSPTGEPRDDRSFQYRPDPVPARAVGVRVAEPAAVLTTFMNTLMSAEADAVCGAPYGESSPERINVRNGYRHPRVRHPCLADR